MNRKLHDPIARSIHDRLLNLAVAQKEDFNAVLVRYGNERLLYRLSRTRHGKHFILKGAALFVLWLGRIHRPTRDLDLLATGRMDEFGKDVTKVLQWKAFIRNSRAGDGSSNLLTTVQHVRTFLEPVLIAINSRTVFDGYWPPAGPWGKRRACPIG